ncbi:hypothetical protein GVN16_21135 [Emticicia sp. CRIBPO]|uniref:hypothetical protein n=1 Tax=Emticicia sp. CRIBPO TaxID=2683258 RepID=UPI001412EF70|nr:hypothetical protein [Emticicia sp. CRIBPO]NBA88290.1 hypothetical protein [Emticicia sp. CRIBPO]
MKTFLLIISLAIPFLSHSQILVESVEGDEIIQNPNGLANGHLLGSLNSNDQSLQFKTYFALPNNNGVMPLKYITAGIKAKPSDGVATLFSAGKFNASTNYNVGYTKIYLFTNREKESNLIDFVTVRYDFQVNKYTLFKNDTIFSKQVSNFNFNGSSLSFNYNLLVKGKHLITAILGYTRTNNYSTLQGVEVKDYTRVYDSTSTTFREYGKTITGRQGTYEEFDRFPVRFAYTNCPSENEEDKDKLKIGYTIYYSTNLGKIKLISNIGGILYLTKQSEKTGVRVPIIGLGIQSNDFFDVQNKGNSLSKRLTYSLTTTFNLANF